MCGIAGFLTGGRSSSPDKLIARTAAMARALAHRGPDDEGIWTDPAAGVGLGHRRLAILDLTPEGHQPMLSPGGRYVIAFNGEIYNYREIRGEIEAAWAARFRGSSDTEVMLAAFEQWGLEKSLERFNGMFAFAVWDRRARRLAIARDRFGEKPLYYGWSRGTFLFGSEMKALGSHPAFEGEIDPRAVALYLRFGYVPAPLTIYRGIRKLEPGGFLTVNGETGAATGPVRFYWSAGEAASRAQAEPFRGSFEDAAGELEALLEDAVRMRMIADVPLGAFLSGGIDSSTVVAMMRKSSPRRVQTFTIGFEEDRFNEAEYARGVARHLETDHTELYVTPAEAMEVIPHLPALYDEPFADSSQIPTFLVSRLARSQVTVSLSGDGGDELFGGYVRYHWVRSLWAATRWWPEWLRQAVAGVMRSVSPASWDRALEWVGPWLPAPLRVAQPGDKMHKLAGVVVAGTAEEMYRRLVSHWTEAEVPRLCRGRPEAAPDRAMTAPARPGSSDITHRMMYLDTVTYLPDDILVKLDRAAMGVSLESRVPFLDPRVFEFAWRLPLDMKVGRGSGKRILRAVVERHVPRALLERPKSGFGVPVGEWLRGPLRDWAEELLDPRRLEEEGLLDPLLIRRKWHEHLSGRRNWVAPLWTVLMLEAWLAEQRPKPARGIEEVPAIAHV